MNHSQIIIKKSYINMSNKPALGGCASNGGLDLGNVVGKDIRIGTWARVRSAWVSRVAVKVL